MDDVVQTAHRILLGFVALGMAYLIHQSGKIRSQIHQLKEITVADDTAAQQATADLTGEVVNLEAAVDNLTTVDTELESAINALKADLGTHGVDPATVEALVARFVAARTRLAGIATSLAAETASLPPAVPPTEPAPTT